MSKNPETKFMEFIDAALVKEFGEKIFIENIQQASKKFSSDRYICLNGIFVALEGKTDDGAATPGQILKLLDIKKAGGIGMLVTPLTWHICFEKLKQVYAYAKYRTL